MPRWMLASLAAITVASPALAQDDGPMSHDDLMALAADKNIKLKQDKLVAAIEASEFDWSFEDVYALVDMDHPPEVVKPAAGKAGMFYDGPKSLNSIIKAGREGAAPETITITSNDDFVVVFEYFNDVKYAIEAANKEAEAIDPRASHESDDDWYLRKRRAEEARLAKVAPLEGKVDKAVFDLVLSGPKVSAGGCERPVVSIPLEKIDFGLYRYTLGGKQVDLELTGVTGNKVDKVAFLASGGRHFEAIGACGAGPVFTAKVSRPHDSDAWTGSAQFK